MSKNLIIFNLILVILFMFINNLIIDYTFKNEFIENLESLVRIFTLLISMLNISFIFLFFANNRKYDINKRKSDVYVDWVSKNIWSQKEEFDKIFDKISKVIKIFSDNMNDKNYRKTSVQIKTELTSLEGVLRNPIRIVSYDLFEKINFLIEQFEDDLNFSLENLLGGNQEITSVKINQEIYEKQIELYKLIFEYQIEITK